MSQDFWYGLLALPALLIILGLAVVVPLGALWLIDYANRWRIKRSNKIRVYTYRWGDKSRDLVEDDDNRLWIAATLATAENVRYVATPLGAFIHVTGRFDRDTTRLLRADLRNAVLKHVPKDEEA